jgi:hypothetical protein
MEREKKANCWELSFHFDGAEMRNTPTMKAKRTNSVNSLMHKMQLETTATSERKKSMAIGAQSSCRLIDSILHHKAQLAGNFGEFCQASRFIQLVLPETRPTLTGISHLPR